MYPFWKWSTIIFALQLAIVAVTFYATWNPLAGVALAIIVSLGLSIILLPVIALVGNGKPPVLVVVTSLIPTTIFAAAGFMFPEYPMGAAIASGIFGVTAVVCVYRCNPSDPVPLCLLAALPFGIGTVLGGLAYLWKFPKQLAEA